MATVEELLAEQLTAAKERIEELEGENQNLERALQEDHGWRRPKNIKDNPALPLPRLELAYEQVDPEDPSDWSDFHVTYRLVLQHLVDDVYAIPIGRTRIQPSLGRKPEEDHLPFRDGCHIAHDAALLALPAYKIMPGEEPKLLELYTTHKHQVALGRDRRRSEKR